jgi:hypothetical protein
MPLIQIKTLIPSFQKSRKLGLLKACACMGVFLLCGFTSYAATITAASCAQSDVQKAVNSAATGDIVFVPGSCTQSWSTAVDIPSSKGITVLGGGTVTLTGAGFTLESNISAVSRISNFTFTSSNIAISVTGTTSSFVYRIDHNIFTNSSQMTFIQVGGNGPGLIDHNMISGGGASEMIHNLGMGPGSNAGWVDNVTPGGPNMVFVEDNTLTCLDTTFICSGIQSYYGARSVLRHNEFIFSQIDQHGTAGNIGARWWEAYQNDFNTPNNENQCCLITMRAGTGVIWGNTTSGTNSHGGGEGIDLYEEDIGTWPLAYQIGSGINGETNQHNNCGATNSSPAYIWGNAPSIAISTSGDTGVVNLNRDYFVSATRPVTMQRQEISGDTCSTSYSYVPYTYPHPLQGTANAPSPPSGLTAVAH